MLSPSTQPPSLKHRHLRTTVVCLIVIILSLVSLIQCIVRRHTVGVVVSILAFLLSLLLMALLNKQIPIWLLRSLHLLYSLLVIQLLLFMLVKLVSDQNGYQLFPQQCTKMSACSRVTLDHPWRQQDMIMPILNVNTPTLEKTILQWLDQQPSTLLQNRIIDQSYLFIHSSFFSFYWNFIDDFYIRLDCVHGQTRLQVHSESRIGKSDLGANPLRIQTLLNWLSLSQLPIGLCL